MRWANDLAVRFDHGISARWGVARIASTSSAVSGLDIEVGRHPARRPRTAAIRPLPEQRDPPAACVGLAREPVPRQAGQDAGAEQRRRGAEQVEHLLQPSPHPRLPRGGPHHPGDVTAGQSRDPTLRRPLHGPEAVVRARGEPPGGGGRPGQATLEDATSTRTAVRRPLPQPAVQDFGSQRRGGHPLGVDRVERADGVAHGHDPVGEPPEAVVVPQAVLGRALAGDGGQRLGPRDRLVERRAPQAAGEGEEAGLVGGRVVAVAADQRDEPAPPSTGMTRPPRGSAGGACWMYKPFQSDTNSAGGGRTARRSPGSS